LAIVIPMVITRRHCIIEVVSIRNLFRLLKRTKASFHAFNCNDDHSTVNEYCLGIKFSNTRRVLEDIGIRNPTFDDCAIVQHICRQVSKRAARLAGAGKHTVNIMREEEEIECKQVFIFFFCFFVFNIQL
jgi:hypothetical protein